MSQEKQLVSKDNQKVHFQGKVKVNVRGGLGGAIGFKTGWSFPRGSSTLKSWL